jgi:hypothetical protein
MFIGKKVSFRIGTFCDLGERDDNEFELNLGQIGYIKDENHGPTFQVVQMKSGWKVEDGCVLSRLILECLIRKPTNH